MIDWPEKEHYTAEDLVQIIRILRDPQEGCPWDKVQTHQSIRKNFLEETCEALEAIDADDPQMLREELGDVLMQVAFHAVLEEEQGRSTFSDICREVCEKLVFRHPHLFASSAAQNAGINGWDALKNKEKGRQTLADELDTVPATLPALMRAQKLQKRAAGHGIGPAGEEQALDTLRQAADRWRAAAQGDVPSDQAARAAGELLFAAVDSIRLAGLDAEEALTFASKAFCRTLEGGQGADRTEH
ncbi:MazG family protein [Faecalibacterium sp. An192]|uniref:MazG family protein n=1 Tax=Faecalibacterium sp. An192 TaxID=1965581 RepID=UPI000B39858B|nr:MazG family protein [Faecalibacterium sp. An192]OUP28375.1 nucleotide pyrophosphohydrolase [Faecalibacterium sp. An192]